MSPGFWHGATIAFVLTHTGYLIYLRRIGVLPWKLPTQQRGGNES